MEQKIIHTYWQNKVFIIKREIPSFVISVTSKISRFNLKDDKFKAKNKKGEILVDKDGTPLLKIKNSTGDYKNTTLRKLLIEEIKLILNKQKELNSKITDDFITEYLKN